MWNHFVVAKMIGSPGKNEAYIFIQNCFSVIMTITKLLV